MPSDASPSTFAAFDAARLQRFERRLASAAASWAGLPRVSFDADFAEDLDELESEASGVVLESLLDRIDSSRRESRDALRADALGARFLIHRFGVSQQTGEAEVAARGFFDTWDRPPLALWLEALSRPIPRREGVFEVCVLVFVPHDRVAGAEAGRAACTTGALFFLDECDGELAEQLAPLLNRGGVSEAARKER